MIILYIILKEIQSEVIFILFLKKIIKCILAVFDCAGHGVPGALLTMILGSFMQNIIQKSK